MTMNDWAWQAALEINRDGDSANTIPIWEIIKKHYSKQEGNISFTPEQENK